MVKICRLHWMTQKTVNGGSLIKGQRQGSEPCCPASVITILICARWARLLKQQSLIRYCLSFAAQGKQTSVFRFHLQQAIRSLPFGFSVCSKQMKVVIFLLVLFSLCRIPETWRHGHGEMETWRNGPGDTDMETRRHGHGDMGMETWQWRHAHGDTDMEK